MKGPVYVTGTHAGCRAIFHLFIQSAGRTGYTNNRIFAGKVKGFEAAFDIGEVGLVSHCDVYFEITAFTAALPLWL